MSPLDSIRYHKSFLRTGFMSMDPRTGHVKAYVGGIDYNDFQYDMVNGAVVRSVPLLNLTSIPLQ